MQHQQRQPVLADVLATPEWRHDAECAHYVGLVNFFPARGESAREAKAICAVCTVQPECLEYALETEAAYGVWGGLSERERSRLRRDRRRVARRARH